MGKRVATRPLDRKDADDSEEEQEFQENLGDEHELDTEDQIADRKIRKIKRRIPQGEEAGKDGEDKEEANGDTKEEKEGDEKKEEKKSLFGGGLFGSATTNKPLFGGDTKSTSLFGAPASKDGNGEQKSLFTNTGNQKSLFGDTKGSSLFGAPTGGSLFSNGNSLFGDPKQSNVFAKPAAEGKEGEEEEENYDNSQNEGPPMVLESVEEQKSVYSKVFEVLVDKFKVAKPEKRTCGSGKLSIRKAIFKIDGEKKDDEKKDDNEGVLMYKVIFQNQIGKVLHESNITGTFSKAKEVEEKAYKYQLKIAVIAETEGKKRGEHCKINFKKQSDMTEFKEAFLKAQTELAAKK